MSARPAEFFAGMGLSRAGIETVFANDIDETKATLYRDNWGDEHLVISDIRALSGDDISEREVKVGQRRTRLAQAQRLELLARRTHEGILMKRPARPPTISPVQSRTGGGDRDAWDGR